MAYRAEDPYANEPERPVRPLYRPQPQTSYQPGVRNPNRRPYAVRDYSDYPVEPPNERAAGGRGRPLQTEYYRRRIPS